MLHATSMHGVTGKAIGTPDTLNDSLITVRRNPLPGERVRGINPLNGEFDFSVPFSTSGRFLPRPRGNCERVRYGGILY